MLHALGLPRSYSSKTCMPSDDDPGQCIPNGSVYENCQFVEIGNWLSLECCTVPRRRECLQCYMGIELVWESSEPAAGMLWTTLPMLFGEDGSEWYAIGDRSVLNQVRQAMSIVWGSPLLHSMQETQLPARSQWRNRSHLLFPSSMFGSQIASWHEVVEHRCTWPSLEKLLFTYCSECLCTSGSIEALKAAIS